MSVCQEERAAQEHAIQFNARTWQRGEFKSEGAAERGKAGSTAVLAQFVLEFPNSQRRGCEMGVEQAARHGPYI